MIDYFCIAVAASGEDPQCTTPKLRRAEMSHYSHPTTPQSTVPSPGAASMNSMQEEYDISSPSWPRTPASPVSVFFCRILCIVKRESVFYVSKRN